MTTLSACLIVKDAQDTLQTVLESVRPHVDEVVVVDTGSTDGTMDLAGRYADTLMDFAWCDDFSAARNHALEACTGDWIIWLDADDQLYGGETLRPLIEQASPEQGMYLLRYVTDRKADGTVLMEFWRERVVRKGATRWMGRAHEVLVPLTDSRYERFTGAWVLHHGHGSPQDSLRRNIRLLELAHAEMPEDTRTLFYLGRDLVTLGSLERGEQVLERYLGLATWPDEMFIAQQLIGYCLRVKRDWQAAYAADLDLQGIHPTWPQAYFALAEDAYYMQKWEWVIHYTDVGMRLPKPDTNLFTAHHAIDSEWMIYRTVALTNVGRLEEAMALTQRALQLRPEDPHHRFNLEYIGNILEQRRALPGSQPNGLLAPPPRLDNGHYSGVPTPGDSGPVPLPAAAVHPQATPARGD